MCSTSFVFLHFYFSFLATVYGNQCQQAKIFDGWTKLFDDGIARECDKFERLLQGRTEDQCKTECSSDSRYFTHYAHNNWCLCSRVICAPNKNINAGSEPTIYTKQEDYMPKACPPGYKVKLGITCLSYPDACRPDPNATYNTCAEKLELPQGANKASTNLLFKASQNTILSRQERNLCGPDKYAMRGYKCVECEPGRYTKPESSFSRYECDACIPGRFSNKKRYVCNTDTHACEAPTNRLQHVPSSGMSAPQRCADYTFPFRLLRPEITKAIANDSPSLKTYQAVLEGISGSGVRYATSVNEQIQTSFILQASDACVQCPFGFVYDATRIDTIPCVACPAGKISSNTSSFCSPCPSCTYRAGTSIDTPAWPAICVSCPSGRYSKSGATICHACAAGTSTLDRKCSAAEDCTIACPPGQLVKSPFPNLICENCPRGRASTGYNAKSNCDICPVGHYQDERGQYRCEKCNFGRMSSESRTTCLDCMPGTYASGLDIVDKNCTACPPGKFTGTKGMDHCIECPRGKYADGMQNTQCSRCPAGKYQDKTHQKKCKNCEVGKYQGGPGSAGLHPVTCTPCAPGYLAEGTGSSSCAIAKDYQFTLDITTGLVPYADYAKAFGNWTTGTFGSFNATACPPSTWTGPTELPGGLRLKSREQALLFTRFARHGPYPEIDQRNPNDASFRLPQTSRRRGCNLCPKGTMAWEKRGYCEPCPTSKPKWWTFSFLINNLVDYGYTVTQEAGSCRPCGEDIDIGIIFKPLIPFKINTSPSFGESPIDVNRDWLRWDKIRGCKILGSCNYADYPDQCGYDEWIENVNMFFILLGVCTALICCGCCFSKTASSFTQLAKCACFSCTYTVEAFSAFTAKFASIAKGCLIYVWYYPVKVIGWLLRTVPVFVSFTVEMLLLTLPTVIFYKLCIIEISECFQENQKMFFKLFCCDFIKPHNSEQSKTDKDHTTNLNFRATIVGCILSLSCTGNCIIIITLHQSENTGLQFFKISMLTIAILYFVVSCVEFIFYTYFKYKDEDINANKFVNFSNSLYYKYSLLFIVYWNIVFYFLVIE